MRPRVVHAEAAFYIRRMRSLAFRHWCVLIVIVVFASGLPVHEIHGMHASSAIGAMALGTSAGQSSLEDCPTDHHSSKAAAIVACAKACSAMAAVLPAGPLPLTPNAAQAISPADAYRAGLKTAPDPFPPRPVNIA